MQRSHRIKGYMSNYAVILFNLGGPDSLKAIKPFLLNLFSDQDIFKIPIGQRFFAKIMSTCRASKVRKKYKQIGGKSPINEWTQVQQLMLQQALLKEISSIEVYTAMRYWNPAIRKVAEKISKINYNKIVLLPLFPHYSITTTGSAFNEWNRFYPGDPDRLIYVHDYYEHNKYISALNERIDEKLLCFPESVRNHIQIVFSAHGTPESIIKKGDPYLRQTKKTVEKVMAARNFSHEHYLSFQSKVGPFKWLKPSTDKMIAELAEKKKRQLLIVPISFVSDHIETLFELEIEYRAIADKMGIENYMVMKGLNDSKTFVASLKEIVVNAINLEQSANRN